MKNAGHYLVNIKIGDNACENAFFQILKKIDLHPLTVIDEAAYAIKSELSTSEIFKLLSAALALEDTLVVIPINNKYEAQSPAFIHWIKFGD